MSVPVVLTGSDRWFSYYPSAKRPSANVALLYSGGQNNSSALASIGGAASATAERYIHSQSFSPSTISGVTITHAARNPVGVGGTLQFIAASSLLVWTTHTGTVSSLYVDSDGWYAIGDTLNGYLRLYVSVGLLPSIDVSQPVAIVDALSTLFDSPAGNELIDGSTEYRALYLVNESSATLDGVKLTMLATYSPESEIYVGSTFIPRSNYYTLSQEGLSFGNICIRGGSAPVSSSTSAIYTRESLKSTHTIATPKFAYFPVDLAQSSNGVDTDIEVLLQDRYDSTGKLTNVVWGTTLYWTGILPGKMVSFWVKRVVPPKAVIPLTESVEFDITFTVK